MADDPKRAKPRGAPFRPGNPRKPKGARNRATRAMAGLLDGEHEKLTRKAVELALGGDLGALRLCLDRLAPRARDLPLAITLPPIETAEDTYNASTAVLAALVTGEITPSEAGQMMSVLTSHKDIVDACVHEQRLNRIEQRMDEQKRERDRGRR